MSAPIPVSEPNDDNSYSFTAGVTCDADGSPHAYNQPPSPGLDYLANAGNEKDGWWALACNAHGAPYVQGSDGPQAAPMYDDTCEGYYVSTTSYQRSEFPKNDPRRYVNSEIEPFIVLPKHWRHEIPGVVLGCRATVTDTRSGLEVEAVVADFGPKGHIGEASMAVCRALGLSDNPKNGGSESPHYRYTFFPGEAAPGYELQPV